ncbi:MAG: carbon-nitrogen hydrolase family protein [Verrucomicrobia bacterium]|nr:carbon-nitrogen hydrolase family protein [Verrucomicrobiota bacterium]
MKPVRIASISITAHHPQPADFKKTLRKAESLVLEAGRGSPDIVALPELFAHSAFAVKDWARRAEDLRGETVSRFGALARKLGCMVLCPMLENENGRAYNSLVFISSSGKPISSYHKMIPTIGEMDAGIHPCSRTIVADTPMGRFGALICFDLNFTEIFNALRRARPRIIFFSSMFRGGLRLRYLALECACYVVGSVATSNQLINPLGRLLNKAGTRQESFPSLPQYLEETINLNYGVYHLDENVKRVQELRNRHAGKVRIEVAQAEAPFLLESLDPRLPIEKLEREFKLERSLDYFDRARRRAGLPV